MTTARLADSAVWLSAMLIVSPVSGSLTVFTDHAAWDVAAGSATAIDFTGWETGTIITTQYEALGFVARAFGVAFRKEKRSGWAAGGSSASHQAPDASFDAAETPLRTAAAEAKGRCSATPAW
jgi:hypothetical protein